MATAIQAGISNNAVFRLKKTHDALKPDVQALKNELEDHLTECTVSLNRLKPIRFVDRQTDIADRPIDSIHCRISLSQTLSSD